MRFYRRQCQKCATIGTDINYVDWYALLRMWLCRRCFVGRGD